MFEYIDKIVLENTFIGIFQHDFFYNDFFISAGITVFHGNHSNGTAAAHILSVFLHAAGHPGYRIKGILIDTYINSFRFRRHRSQNCADHDFSRALHHETVTGSDVRFICKTIDDQRPGLSKP